MFPYFGRLVVSSEAQAQAAVAYLCQLGVSHVNFLGIPGQYGEAYRAAFLPLAQAGGIRVLATSIPLTSKDEGKFDNALKQTAKFRYRYTLAVIDTMDQYEALMIAAHNCGMIGADFVWLLSADGIDMRVFKN